MGDGFDRFFIFGSEIYFNCFVRRVCVMSTSVCSVVVCGNGYGYGDG